MRKCGGCKVEKLLTLKNFGRKGIGFQTECRECKKIYMKKHYKENKAYYINKAKAKKEQIKKIVDDYKAQTPCMDCGKNFPHYCMDFDHRDPTTKLECVASLIGNNNFKALVDEIQKCDLVCAICHRIRTFTGSRISSAS